MCPVIVRSAAPTCGHELNTVLLFERAHVTLCQPNGDLDGNRHAVVGEHEPLQRFVTQLVVANGRNDQTRDARRHILFAIDYNARDVSKFWTRLRSTPTFFRTEEFVRTNEGHRFQEICERCEARVAVPLIIKLAFAQKLELTAVKGVTIDLAVVELDGANGLRRRENMAAALAQAKVAHVRFVLCNPTCECRRPDPAAALRSDAGDSIFHRIAEAVGRERVENRAEGVGLVAQRRRSRREGALAGCTPPELHDLEFLSARTATRENAAAAVRTGIGKF